MFIPSKRHALTSHWKRVTWWVLDVKRTMTIIVVIVVPCCRSVSPVCVRGRWLLFEGAGCCSRVLAVVRGCWLSFVGTCCHSWVLARRSSLQLVTWHGHVVVVVSVCRGGWVVKQGGGGCWLQPRRCNDMHLLFVWKKGEGESSHITHLQ